MSRGTDLVDALTNLANEREFEEGSGRSDPQPRLDFMEVSNELRSYVYELEEFARTGNQTRGGIVDHDEDHNERIVRADTMQKDHNPQSRYGVICCHHDAQGLTYKQYADQMSEADSKWHCPVKGCTSTRVFFDDDRYENTWPWRGDNEDA